MKLSSIAAEINSPLGSDAENVEITGVKNNSGKIVPGDLFVAIKGYKLDGADFVADAVAHGAAAVLVSSGRKDLTVKFPDTPFVFSDMDMRLAESKVAKIFHPAEPRFIAAVTGTNGKSSVVNFARQLWELDGVNAASIGTIGVKSSSVKVEKSLTTPDAIELHTRLDELVRAGVDFAAIETSNHGIEQRRADSVKIMAAGFTNLSNDHLDYYKDQDEYFHAKLRLFSELLDANGLAMVNADDRRGKEILDVCAERGIKTALFGEGADCDIRLESYEIRNDRQHVVLNVFGKRYEAALDLITKFQIYNLMCAIGLFVASGRDFSRIAPRLGELKNEAGRIEFVACAPSGAKIFVDFGHNGDGIEKLLADFRPYVGKNLVCVIGCPGDRPEVRRIEIGKALQKHADKVVVVDDNPRGEDPKKIRETLLKYCPKATEIPDRNRAIEEVIDASRSWDSIVICGTLYEKDKEFIREKLRPRQMELKGLLSAANLASETPIDERKIASVACDSRISTTPAVFVGIQGFTRNGADFAGQAIDNGATALVVQNDYKFDATTAAKIKDGNIAVARADNPRKAFADLAYNFYGRRQPETMCAVTGTSGKSSVVDFLRQMWGLLGLPSLSNGTIGMIVENVYVEKKNIVIADAHYTTPIGDELYKNLAYFADKGVQNGVLEMSSHGMDQLRAENIRISAAGFTNIGTDHMDFYGSRDKYMESKSVLFSKILAAGGTAVLNADIKEFSWLKSICDNRGIRVFDYGKNAQDLKIVEQDVSLDGQTARVEIFGEPCDLKLGLLGSFQLNNMLCALGLLAATTQDWKDVIPRLDRLKNALGRLEFIGDTKLGAKVFVDFAYKGDALEHTLKTLRSMSKGRIIAVFSTCGDIYETRRRKELGEAAEKNADIAILTDDSPRTEDPQKIRDEVLQFCPGAIEVKTGRRDAIKQAIGLAKKDDVILVAGKGHEDFITVGTRDIPYTDQETIRELLKT